MKNKIAIEVKGVEKFFGEKQVLKNINFTAELGEFVCLLGPSGCGKTTVLRIIAGLEQTSSGKVFQNGVDITEYHASKRDYGIVFQSYALFPNLTAHDNIAYGLYNMKLPKMEVDKIVHDLLKLIRLPDIGDKYPAQISGGQQQRVALARALAMRPKLLLLDEPLSALDSHERVRLRNEIKSLQKKFGITTIMVTHDQEEALTISDRIIVMNEGTIEQVGTAVEVYDNPHSKFVGDFIGKSNFIRAVAQLDGTYHFNKFVLKANLGEYDELKVVDLFFRPEDIKYSTEDGFADHNVLSTNIRLIEFMGSYVICKVVLDDSDIEVQLQIAYQDYYNSPIPGGSPRLYIHIPADRVKVFINE